MRIALLSTSDSGGAGRAALRLNQALELIGEEATMFVKQKYTTQNKVHKIGGREVSNELERIVNTYINSNIYKGNTMLSTMYPSIGFKYLDELLDYDVVNLHWIVSFISMEAINKLAEQRKKIVWTLHDQNPMTGVCHYTHECERYVDLCNNCPQMKYNPYDYSKAALEVKIKYMPKELVVVSPSEWLADCARKSRVFRHNRIEVIPNMIDGEIFKNIDKKIAKQKLGISPNKKVILFGAENHKEKRKGFKELVDVMKRLKTLVKEELVILTFGEASQEIKQMGMQTVSLGYIKNDSKLALAYSAADVLAFSSLEDNLPNILLEALVCNTPVVAFDTGGMPEVVKNGETGFIVPYKDIEAFADRVYQILFKLESSHFRCRDFAVEKYNYERQAKSYADLYKDIAIKEVGNSEENRNIPTIYPEISQALIQYIFEYNLLEKGLLETDIKTILRNVKNKLRR